MRSDPSPRFGLPLPAVLLLVAIPVAWAFRYWFVCDDAFITFRYVRNFLRGDGLVWNVGEYVEGYTNFLWALEIGGLWALGWRPESASVWLSLGWTVVLGLTIAALAARTLPADHDGTRRQRAGLVAIALLLWGTNRSVAVWASSGLEMRQFTALCTLGLLWAHGDRSHRGSIAAGTAYGLAALTRPEALLFGPAVMVVWAWRAWRDGALRMGNALRLGVPFGLLVGSHLLWRRSYYGEWLPNTYYAKNVRDWWDAGAAFVGYISLEHALYLTVPLALLGAWRRAQDEDTLGWFAAAWMGPYLLHLVKIGGDHFEFRMFDVVWPVLYVFAADGIGALADRVRTALPAARRTLARGLITATCVVYGLALPLAHDQGAFEVRSMVYRLKVPITTERSPWLWAVPGAPLLVWPHQQLGDWLANHAIAARQRTHALFAEMMLDRYGAFRAVEDEVLFAPTAVTKASSIGVIGFYLDDLALIDILGLTDHTIARHDDVGPNAQRRMGHDRRPPRGYLDQRGYNLVVKPTVSSRASALRKAPHAFELVPGTWVPIVARGGAQAVDLVVGRDVVTRD